MKHLIFIVILIILYCIFKNKIEQFTNININIKDNIFIINELVITHKHNGMIIEKKVVKNPKKNQYVNIDEIRDIGKHIFTLEYKNSLTGNLIKTNTKVIEVAYKDLVGVDAKSKVLIDYMSESELANRTNATYTTKENTYMVAGNELSSMIIKGKGVSGVKECRDRCSSSDSCAGFTYNGDACWLKTKVSNGSFGTSNNWNTEIKENYKNFTTKSGKTLNNKVLFSSTSDIPQCRTNCRNDASCEAIEYFTFRKKDGETYTRCNLAKNISDGSLRDRNKITVELKNRM